MSLGNIEIENLGSQALNKPNSVDLRIGNSLYVFEYDIVDTKESFTYFNEVLYDKPNYLRKIVIPETGLLLQPHKVYLTKTIEKVTTHGFIPVMHGKTALSLLGVSTELTSGYKEDEFSNYLFLSIIATKPTIIYPDIKIGNLVFFPSLSVSSITQPIRSDIVYGTYSSGMYMRLAFSIAINVDADILLIDEILSVGDEHFQNKCFEKMLELKNEGKTMVFVTHSMESVKRLCDRTIWLQNGKIRMDGDTNKVVEEYIKETR